MPQQDPVPAISPLEDIYPSWSWSKYALVMMSSCPAMRPSSQAYAKAPKGFSKHILCDLGTSAMQKCHLQPHVTCLLSRSFLGHRAQVSYVHRISRLSFGVWRNFTRHQSCTKLSHGFYKLLMDMFSFGFSRQRLLPTCFKRDFLCVLWVPNSERHCDLLFTEVRSLFKTRTDEKVWQHFVVKAEEPAIAMVINNDIQKIPSVAAYISVDVAWLRRGKSKCYPLTLTMWSARNTAHSSNNKVDHAAMHL